MGFVRSQLREGEVIVFETRLHKIIFYLPVLLTILLALVGLWSRGHPAAIIPAGLSLFWILFVFIRYRTSEFVVTNRRVLIKTGLISRRSMETNLTKVEGINVDQTIPGRLLGYGTIVVRGTGGGSEPFSIIAHPMEFRNVVQEQIEHASAVAPVAPLPSVTPGRATRTCPWCAEVILAEARICRFCQREVEPIKEARLEG